MYILRIHTWHRENWRHEIFQGVKSNALANDARCAMLILRQAWNGLNGVVSNTNHVLKSEEQQDGWFGQKAGWRKADNVIPPKGTRSCQPQGESVSQALPKLD